MDVAQSLLELYGRIPPVARQVIDGLDMDVVTEPPAPGANTIAWLVWHTARVQDHHIAEILAADQVWVGGSWAADFGLEADPSNTGYGHSVAQAQAIRPVRVEVLVGYLDAVHARSVSFLQSVTPADLDRVVDRRFDPPVTMGVRLVSIATDALEHVGQAAYARGILVA